MSIFRTFAQKEAKESSRPSLGALQPTGNVTRSGEPVLAPTKSASAQPTGNVTRSGRPVLGSPQNATYQPTGNVTRSGRPSFSSRGQDTVSVFNLLNPEERSFLEQKGNEELLADALKQEVKLGRTWGEQMQRGPLQEKALEAFRPKISLQKAKIEGRELFEPRTQAGEIPDYIARLSQSPQDATLSTLMRLPTLPIGQQELGTLRQNPFKKAAKRDLAQRDLLQPSLPKVNLYGFERAPNMVPGTLQHIATQGQKMIKSGQALNPTILKATSV